jgi:hypothetical protein
LTRAKMRDSAQQASWDRLRNPRGAMSGQPARSVQDELVDSLRNHLNVFIDVRHDMSHSPQVLLELRIALVDRRTEPISRWPRELSRDDDFERSPQREQIDGQVAWQRAEEVLERYLSLKPTWPTARRGERKKTRSSSRGCLGRTCVRRSSGMAAAWGL